MASYDKNSGRDQGRRPHEQQRLSTAEWLARNFPGTPAAASVTGDRIGTQIASLVVRNLTDAAWKLCIEAERAPEHFGIYIDYDAEEWAAIARFVDASHARYKWDWQVGDIVFPPSVLIEFGFIARSLNYSEGTRLCHLLGRSIEPFAEAYVGRTDRNEDSCLLNAYHWRRLVVEEARRRYRSGFYADPFAPEPMRRPS